MSESKSPSGDYEVGYKRPPKANQFKPGEVNNPKGRPKGRTSAKEALLREGARLVRIRKGEEVTTIPRTDALMRTLFNMALEGDLAAARLVLPYLIQADADAMRDKLRGEDSTSDAEAPLPQMDEEAVRRMLARFSHLNSDQEAP
jgi:hypothetical protein